MTGNPEYHEIRKTQALQAFLRAITEDGMSAARSMRLDASYASARASQTQTLERASRYGSQN
jgi:hypothetical protein